MDCCDPPRTLDLETTDDQHALAVRGFVALWQGQRPQPAELGASPDTVAAMAQAGRIEIDTDSRLAAVHGLTTRPSPHRITHPGGTINTWCAFDAIGIPAALGLDATAITTCPACGREIQVGLAAGQPAVLDDLRLWLPERPCAHLVKDFCAHANLYCNADHLATNAHGPGRQLTVTQGAQLGSTTWADAAHALRRPGAST